MVVYRLLDQFLIAESKHQYLQWNPEKEYAHYNYMETFVIHQNKSYRKKYTKTLQ